MRYGNQVGSWEVYGCITNLKKKALSMGSSAFFQENERIQILNMPSDHQLSNATFLKEYKDEIDDRDRALFNQQNMGRNDINCYTDESKLKEGVGAEVRCR